MQASGAARTPLCGRARVGFFFGLTALACSVAFPILSVLLLGIFFSSSGSSMPAWLDVAAYLPLVLAVVAVASAVTGLVLGIQALKIIAFTKQRGKPLAVLAIVFSGVTFFLFFVLLLMIF